MYYCTSVFLKSIKNYHCTIKKHLTRILSVHTREDFSKKKSMKWWLSCFITQSSINEKNMASQSIIGAFLFIVRMLCILRWYAFSSFNYFNMQYQNFLTISTSVSNYEGLIQNSLTFLVCANTSCSGISIIQSTILQIIITYTKHWKCLKFSLLYSMIYFIYIYVFILMIYILIGTENTYRGWFLKSSVPQFPLYLNASSEIQHRTWCLSWARAFTVQCCSACWQWLTSAQDLSTLQNPSLSFPLKHSQVKEMMSRMWILGSLVPFTCNDTHYLSFASFASLVSFASLLSLVSLDSLESLVLSETWTESHQVAPNFLQASRIPSKTSSRFRIPPKKYPFPVASMDTSIAIPPPGIHG